MNQEISEIIRMINDVSPFLLETASRQVKVQILGSFISLLFGSVCIIGVFFILAKYHNKVKKMLDENDPMLGVVILSCTILSIVGLVVTLASINGLLGRLMNPDYYAIEAIISLIRRGIA